MEQEKKNEELLDSKYKEVKINKIIIDGKEQEGNIINSEDTKDKQELNITVYTKAVQADETNEGGLSRFYELLQKVLFRNRRS